MFTGPTATHAGGSSLRIQSFAASAALVVLACVAYRYMPFAYHRSQFGALYGFGAFRFTGEQFLYLAAGLYTAALACFHATEPEGKPSKALRAFQFLWRFGCAPLAVLRAGMTAEDRLALLASLLKAFFAPLMVMGLMVFCVDAVAIGARILEGNHTTGWLLGASYWMTLKVLVLIDVVIFTVGYLVELPSLGNRIRSVDPTPWGWAAALACYPPFNVVTGYIIGSTVSDHPQFDDPTTHVLMNISLLVFVGIYTAASVSLGWKGSNLTHRGIVSRGPYAVVRHPAYICKNIAWWIGSVPIFVKGFEVSLWAGGAALLSMASWTAIYALRALTEEDHLRAVDGEYAAYAAKVRYRFVPGLV
jgi:protein-S-isoprenylcysteine O-methyltransferase Ste14